MGKKLALEIGIIMFFIIIGVFMILVFVMILVFDMNSLSNNNK
jgi:hypothetical protein